MKKTSEAVEKNFVNLKMCSSEIDESEKKRSSYRIGACGNMCPVNEGESLDEG